MQIWMRFCFAFLIMTGMASMPLQTTSIWIENPASGDALQGQVSINGGYQIAEAKELEVSFRFQDSDLQNWFVISRIVQPADGKIFILWDTTTIADGTYSLRVRLLMQNGESDELIIPDLRVRNYSIIETNTPVPFVIQMPEAAQNEALNATPTPQKVTATPYPRNNLEVDSQDLVTNAYQGIIFSILIFIVFGIYFLLKNKSKG